MDKTGWFVVAIVIVTALVWARGMASPSDPLCQAFQQALAAEDPPSLATIR